MSSKAKETKVKINKWALIKLKSLCITKKIVDKMKRLSSQLPKYILAPSTPCNGPYSLNSIPYIDLNTHTNTPFYNLPDPFLSIVPFPFPFFPAASLSLFLTLLICLSNHHQVWCASTDSQFCATNRWSATKSLPWGTSPLGDFSSGEHKMLTETQRRKEDIS